MKTDYFNIVDEILNIGYNTGDKILHFGACDKNQNFLENIVKNNMKIFYLGIDISDDIVDLVEKYQEYPTYAFQKTTMQDFIDDKYHAFHYCLITGIFDKPTYEDKQYIFISTVVHKCLEFSKNVIFTMDAEKYSKNYNFSILYVINNLINSYSKVTIKKIDNSKYIFCITS